MSTYVFFFLFCILSYHLLYYISFSSFSIIHIPFLFSYAVLLTLISSILISHVCHLLCFLHSHCQTFSFSLCFLLSFIPFPFFSLTASFAILTLSFIFCVYEYSLHPFFAPLCHRLYIPSIISPPFSLSHPSLLHSTAISFFLACFLTFISIYVYAFYSNLFFLLFSHPLYPFSPLSLFLPFLFFILLSLCNFPSSPLT